MPLRGCMTIALTILGIVLILAAVGDIFHTLFNPSEHRDLSKWIASCRHPERRSETPGKNFARPLPALNRIEMGAEVGGFGLP